MANSTSTGRGDYAFLTPCPTKAEADNPIGDEPPEARKGPYRRLNTLHLFILLFGSALLLLALIALGLLWKESMRAASPGADPQEPWVQILSGNWATSYVTICTAIMRTTMGFQASLATAMFAGIILERIGVPFISAPFYSILRAVDVAPNNLLSSAIFRSRSPFSLLVYTLVMIEVLVTIASQFLSTILVSDFAGGTLANIANSTMISSNWTSVMDQSYRSSEKWWQVPITTSWAFAEHSEDAVEGLTFADTGATYRAFLPFEAEIQRTKLRRFTGPALVMNQRVVCASPSMFNLSRDGAGVSLQVMGLIGMDHESFPTLEGQKAGMSDDISLVPFNCALNAGKTTTRMGDTSFCFPGNIENMSLKDPFLDSDDRDRTISENTFARRQIHDPLDGLMDGETFLLLDVLYGSAFYTDTDEGLKAGRGDGPWRIITDKSGAETLRATACTTRLDARALEVDMMGSRDRIEPTIQWNNRTETYDTAQVLRQLGASLTPESPEERGILTLEPDATWWRRDYPDPPSLAWNFFSNSLARSMPEPLIGDSDVAVNLTVKLMSWADETNDNDAHAIHAALFETVLNSTDSPALAAQALLARIHQMSYYSEVHRLAATATSSTTFSVSAQVPARWTGFIAATCIIMIHLVVVFMVVALFLCFTRHSLIGNHWQAVSQVTSEETIRLLEQADRMEDEEVKIQAESQSVDMGRCTTLRRRNDGRIALSPEEKSPAIARRVEHKPEAASAAGP